MLKHPESSRRALYLNTAHMESVEGMADEEAFKLLGEWAPDETVRRKILADNPARCFGFA